LLLLALLENRDNGLGAIFQTSGFRAAFMSDAPVSSAGRAMVRVAALADLAEARLKLVRAGNAKLAIVRTGETVRAVSAICTHARIFLAPGELTHDGLIECPMHGAKFSPDDGSVRCPPATAPLAVHEVRLIDGSVYADPGEEPAAAIADSTKPGARPSAAQWGNWG
jgi:3-phenylpropionate/trans-cinnamate dioxygenase ferredoxin subunit